jgi:hypothetical protein
MAHGDLAEVQAPISDRLVILTGLVTLGAGGAISSQECNGFTVAKTGSEVGRYTVSLHNKFLQLEYGHAVVEGAADAAAAAAKGQVAQLRGVDVSGATPQLFVQLLTPSLAAGASVDVEAEDNAKLRIFLCLSRGKI